MFKGHDKNRGPRFKFSQACLEEAEITIVEDPLITRGSILTSKNDERLRYTQRTCDQQLSS